MSERLRLELIGNDARGAELPAVGTLVVGCSRGGSGFLVEGQGVDETHCAIGRTKEGDWAIKDLGSRHGTFVNGQRVSSARLKLGDQIVLGSRRLELRGAATEAARPAARPAPEAQSRLPEKIAGYRVERLLGRGAMGAVYLAVQESLRRPVALKVLSPKLAADHDFVHRFQAEARAAAALSHPNVVVVYDVGEDQGAHYLSMEYMAGGSLEQKLAAGGPLPWKTVLGILSDAAAGLSYAESRGIVHRDIKPANLMYSGTGTVKIADLGLATTVEQEASEAPEGGRKVFGTPHFISPEQARGEPVDQRSDLYSLGATAYRLLSGRTPFEGATTRDILRALQSEEPRPLSELVRILPPELEQLVARLMAKQAAARPPSAEALRRECERLRLVAEHGAVLEQRSGASRAQLWIGAALLSVVAGAISAWYFLGAGRPAVGTADSGLDGSAPPGTPDDNSFFERAPDEFPHTDEERLLRERERQASAELAALSPYLAPAERTAALEQILQRWSGTSAAVTARAELDASSPSGPLSGAALVEETLREVHSRTAWPPPAGALPHPVPALRALGQFSPPAEIGERWGALRDEFARKVVDESQAALRGELARANELAARGDFDGVRGVLQDLEPVFAGLDELPDEAGRLAGLRELRGELAARRAAVDGEERLYREGTERDRRLALGAVLGPDSGVLAELRGLQLDALEARLAALGPELREDGRVRLFADQVGLARGALDALVHEFAQGGWRRKTVIDPRSRRPREVREVRVDGLVFDKDGGLDPLSWQEAPDPDWWHQLFQARLARDWQPAEVRSIVALLRLVGAARGAELARELVDPRGRGLLQPAELETLAQVFAPASQWSREAGAPLADAARSLAAESAAAALLAEALTAAQERAWTRAAASLERCLTEGAGSLLVALLSDGSDWQVVSASPAQPAGPGNVPGAAPGAAAQDPARRATEGDGG